METILPMYRYMPTVVTAPIMQTRVKITAASAVISKVQDLVEHSPPVSELEIILDTNTSNESRSCFITCLEQQ